MQVKNRVLGTILAIITLIIGGMFVFTPNFVSGQIENEIDKLESQLEKKRDKVDQIEKSIQVYKDKAREKRKEAVSLSNQIDILENRKKQTELEIKKTENKIEALNIKLNSLNKDIDKKKNTIDRQKDMMAEFVRTIHKKQDKNYIEIVAAYDNFSDFYDKVQYLQSIEQDLAKSAEAVEVAKTKLEKDKKQKKKIKTNYEDLEEKLTQKKQDLEEQQQLKDSLLAKTQRSELRYKTLVNNLRSQYQEVESEIQSIEKQVRSKLEKQEKLEEKVIGDSTTLSWPTQSRYVTAYFQDPEYPFRHIMEHNAIDIRSAFGTPIKAAASGYVARAKRCSIPSCYSFVMLVHSNGISTVYGHLSSISVSENDFVTRGDVIGQSGGRPGTDGAGPWSTGAHLHLEVRQNGIPKDPLNYLVEDY